MVHLRLLMTAAEPTADRMLDMLDGKAKSDFFLPLPTSCDLLFRAKARLGDRAVRLADDGNRDRQRRAGAGIAGADEIIQLAVFDSAAAHVV